MKFFLIFILCLSSNVHAQKLFGIFGSDEKKSNSEKLTGEIENLLASAKKNKTESSLVDLDKVLELMRKQTQAKISECKEQKAGSKQDCVSDLIEFQEKVVDRLYDIRKDFLVRHHARVLNELEQTRTRHRETVKQAFQMP